MRFCIVKSHYRRRYFKINRTARMYMITLIFFSFAFLIFMPRSAFLCAYIFIFGAG